MNTVNKFFVRIGLVALILALCISSVCVTAYGEDAPVDVTVLDETDYSSYITGIGIKPDASKKYEYVDSPLFNAAPKEMWAMAKSSGFVPQPGVKKDGKTTVNLHTTGGNKYPEIYFWNEMSYGGRSSNGNLFGMATADAYEGICFYINKPADNGYTRFSVMLGKMYTGYWTNSFYTYTFYLPKKEYKGYIYIPYGLFVNDKGDNFDPSSGVNFIAFKYPEAIAKESDIYIGELALFRQATKTGAENPGVVSRGVGTAMDASKDYMYYRSVIFNNSTDAVWARGKNNSFEISTGISENGYVPNGVANSIRLRATGEKAYPEVYFWNEQNASGRATNGLLFGSNINISDYEGIRLWIKADQNNPYSTLTICLGTMFTGYWPKEEVGFYGYTVLIDNGFCGYVNIPFSLFTNNIGSALNPEGLNFIAFKVNELGAGTGDFYIADLKLYGVNNGSQDKAVTNGVALKSEGKYEIVQSKVFAYASQEMWDQSKNSGFTVTAGVNDEGYIPFSGASSVRLHTDGQKQWPEIYYWNEYSLAGRCTQGRFWGDLDNTLYDGVRLWLKVDENNTYSKLDIIIGQMFTGYWPKSEVGFYSYKVIIPVGGFDGYLNIPFSYFKNNKGEELSAQYLNFIGFKYSESGFKESDLYVSDLSLYRLTKNGEKISDTGIITEKPVSVNKVVDPAFTLPTKEEIGGSYLKPTDKNTDSDVKSQTIVKGKTALVIIISVAVLAIGITLLAVFKKKQSN